MDARRTKKTLRDGLVVLAVTLGLLLVSELSLRIAFSNKTADPESPSNPAIAYQFNADYLISLKPNLRKSFIRTPSNGGAKIGWETNSLSFRGAELREHPDIRVMVYGDSNIQADFSTLEHTFCYRLAKYLNEQLAGRHVEVVNSGVAGFGPDQSLLKLSKDVDIYRPDLIVLHVFADNDFGDIVRNRLFDLDKDGSLIRTRFKVEKDKGLVDAEQYVASLKYRLLSSLFLTEAARTLVGLVTRSESEPKNNPSEEIKQYVLRADEEYAVYREGQPQKFSHFYDHYDIDLAIHPKAESSKTKVKLMEAVLGEIKRATQSRQIPLLVLIEPSVIDLTENARVTYKDLQAYKDYRRDALTRSIEAICMRLGMARVNLFEVFMSNRPEVLYFRDPDDHWNDAGQDLAARVTAAYVARNLFKGPSKLLEK